MKSTTGKPSLEVLVKNVLDFLCKSSSISNPTTSKRSEPEASNVNNNDTVHEVIQLDPKNITDPGLH
jgi:hypothetical protein